ncbi:uncharacterized protein RAG0_13830 [Rhynchosporium agropyri]|uniref:Glycosyl transferase family 1 domain-containing protein n=1 Tax=Rhynchosporium agropyri TaxID=914238 RepID=A0A1E1LEE2_9HELO|nr:uncharacterized protein RAG0_13830 [Rhynchosporium agropyri]
MAFVGANGQLIPGIITMNYKYFLDLKVEAPKNGDMPFVMSIINVLRKADAFLGMILYREVEGRFPKLTFTVINGVNCAIIPFNDRMYPELIKDAVTRSCKFLARLAGSDYNPVAIIYHQDERLLEFQPSDIPFAITHHAPLVADLSKIFPLASDILDAFGTDSKSWTKVTELKCLQEQGLRVILNRSDCYVLAMSAIQGDFFRTALREKGMLTDRVLDFPPPLQAMLSGQSPRLCKVPLHGVNRSKFLFTAVARLTFFKHAEILVDGAILLLERGITDLSIFIAGGDESNPHRQIRSDLLNRVPLHLRHYFHFIQRIPQEDLYSYFNSQRVQKTGVFVCCSRYETLGITPLEAALSGDSTVITDSTQVEASRYFPPEYRFKENPTALADCLEGLFRADLSSGGKELMQYVEQSTEARGDFHTEFLQAWSQISEASVNRSKTKYRIVK